MGRSNFVEAGEIAGFKLIYTKVIGDKGPILSTKVSDGYPCVNPEQRTSDAIYYPLESSNFAPKCERSDQRYQNLSPELETDQKTV